MAARKDGKTRAEEFAVTPIDAHVGSRIRYLRNKMGLSAQALGDQIDVTRQAIEKYEKAQQRIPAARLFEIAKVLETAPGWFFEDCPFFETPTGRPDLAPDKMTAAGIAVVDRFERLNPEQRRAVMLVVTAFDEANAAQGAVGK
jgi:transcriptional regulator with XRE-family HTH domain